MLPHRRAIRARTALAAALAAVAISAGSAAADEGRPPLGLMGTIPIYWGEARQLGELIDGSAKAHWARAVLERDYALRPVDRLDARTLEGLDFLLLAQPRALSGEENVALDAWVRGGGRLLLFADPLVTGESAFPLGDRRRPQGTALLSPILAHWGLRLEFDEAQPPGRRYLAGEGSPTLPLDMAGRFAPLGGGESCALSLEGVLARCAIGKGHATIIADAALLDLYEPEPTAERALTELETLAFGEIAGQ